jgi:hypothetical protein
MSTSSRLSWLSVGLVLMLCGCTAGSSEPEAVEPALPTHTHEAVGDSETYGKLSGRPDCLWLENEGVQSKALVLPSGTTTEVEGRDVVLLDEQGEEIARTGDFVAVGGQADLEASSCLDSSDAGAPWLASSVEVCSRDECSPEP